MSQDNTSSSTNFENQDDAKPSSQTEEAHTEVEEHYESFIEEMDTAAHQQQAETPSSDTSSEASRIQKLEEELAVRKDQMIRALAEAENTRRRATKDREEAQKYAISGFSRDLLNVADNLRRALDSIPPELLQEQQSLQGLVDGIEATERELLNSFEKNGIKKMEPLEEPFDPNFHEVMFEAPVPDKESGTIIQVIEAGYTLHGRILRPARVGIAKQAGTASDQQPPAEPGHTIDTEV